MGSRRVRVGAALSVGAWTVVLAVVIHQHRRSVQAQRDRQTLTDHLARINPDRPRSFGVDGTRPPRLTRTGVGQALSTPSSGVGSEAAEVRASRHEHDGGLVAGEPGAGRVPVLGLDPVLGAHAEGEVPDQLVVEA
jgi:hypothetical protein